MKPIKNTLVAVCLAGLVVCWSILSTTSQTKYNSEIFDKAKLALQDEFTNQLKDYESIKQELEWYKTQSLRVLGKDFRPGNLRSTTITLSSYNPVEAQCDKDPLIAADNNLVAPGILALPKHWRISMGIPLGKIVWCPPYGQFIVRDHMNSRKPAGRGDVISFIPKWSTEFGKVHNITMYWVEEDSKS